jgi:glycosyltransferase involved in cell wall biosynthesis
MSSISWGGLEMNILKLACKLREKGHTIIIACNPEGRLFQQAKESFDVVEFGSEFKNDFKSVRKILKRDKFDVIHIFRSGDVNKMILSLFGNYHKSVLIFDPQIGVGVKKKDPFHKFIYQKLDAVIAISKDVADGFIRNLPVKMEKVRVIHLGVDVEKFKFRKDGRERIRGEFNLGDDIVLGVVSRFSPGKGHEELFRAFKILNQEFKNLKLLIVGEPTVGEIDYFSNLKNLEKELGIGESTIWTGFRKDVPDILSAIDIFVAPSHAEAFGLSLVEAMAVGLPVVATKNAGFLDIIDDGVNGLFFERGNHIDLAEKIEMLIKDKTLAKRLGEKASETAREKFSFEKYVNSVENLYLELLKSKQTEARDVQHSKS